MGSVESRDFLALSWCVLVHSTSIYLIRANLARFCLYRFLLILLHRIAELPFFQFFLLSRKPPDLTKLVKQFEM